MIIAQPVYAKIAIMGLTFVAGLIVAIVVAKRIRQFSLRTLLIVMTAVAVALGAIVYAVK